MRKIARINNSNSEIRRLMIYESKEGVYVFLYTDDNDGPCVSCEWYSALSEAEESCIENFGAAIHEWKVIDDPKAGCQHDWVEPVKVRHDADGKPIWGEFEPVDE